jgi:putative nucleotidyltransferase with HDIG domain
MRERILADLDVLHQLPSPSPIVGRLLATLGREDVGLAEVEQIVEGDPVIAAKIVSAANAAAWATHTPTTTIRAALLRLGLVRVRRLALVVSLYSTTAERRAANEFWRHSLAVAHVAEALAGATEAAVDGEAALLAGLVHDMGRLVLATRHPAQTRAVAELAVSEALSLVESERRLLGIDHGEVGAHLARHWGFPPPVVVAVRFHHERDPYALAAEPTVALVGAADALASLDPEWRLGEAVVEDAEPALTVLGLEEAEVPPLVESGLTEARAAVSALAGA